MDEFNDDSHLDVCMDIELDLLREYQDTPELTDSICIFALENAAIAIKQQFGYAKNQRVSKDPRIQGIVERCTSLGLRRIGKINDLSLKDYLARLDKIRKSVIRHSSDGTRAYYDFVSEHLKPAL